MGEAYAHPEVLVSADWVEDHLKDPKVRIVESDEDILLYDLGHIPGAVRIDWQGDLQDQLRPRLHRRRQVRRDLLAVGDRQRHDRRLLRRQVELVGLLRLLGVQAVRPRRLPGLERRPEALARPEAAHDHRGPQLPADAGTPSRAARRNGSGSSATPSWPTPRRGCRMIDVRSPKEFTGEKLHMEDYPQEGALRGGHIPGARTSPGAAPSTRTGPSSRPRS